MGQDKPVVVYRLCSKNTVDERILARAGAKRKLEKMIIGSGTIIINSFIFINNITACKLNCILLYVGLKF